MFQGENLDLAMSKEEVVAMIGEGPCVVKTLTRNHLYCEPPAEQPLPRHHALREAPDASPELLDFLHPALGTSCPLTRPQA